MNDFVINLKDALENAVEESRYVRDHKDELIEAHGLTGYLELSRETYDNMFYLRDIMKLELACLNETNKK